MGRSGIDGNGREAWSAFASLGRSEEGQRLDEGLQKMYQHDFPELPTEKLGHSREDVRALALLDEKCQFVDGRYGNMTGGQRIP